MPVRILTTVEKNHLLKFGFKPEEISKFGEMPVEYITGKAQFFNQYLTVNQNVLIPRVETEELVDKIVEIYKDRIELNFLEVGTGSGAIGLSLTNKFLKLGINVSCTLSDVSPAALAVTNENLANLVDSEYQSKIELVQSDLLANISEVNFDFCVANLPYIPTSRLDQLDESVKDFEPTLALDGGEDGLVIIKRLVNELRVKGFKGDLFLEIDDTHTKEKLIELGVEIKEVWFDSFGKNRFAWLVL